MVMVVSLRSFGAEASYFGNGLDGLAVNDGPVPAVVDWDNASDAEIEKAVTERAVKKPRKAKVEIPVSAYVVTEVKRKSGLAKGKRG